MKDTRVHRYPLQSRVAARALRYDGLSPTYMAMVLLGLLMAGALI